MSTTSRLSRLFGQLAALPPTSGMALNIDIHEGIMAASIVEKGTAFIRIGRNGPLLAAPDTDAQIAAASTLTPFLIQACRDWIDAPAGPVERLLISGWRLARPPGGAPPGDLDAAVLRIASRVATQLPREGVSLLTLLATAKSRRIEWTYGADGSTPAMGDAAAFVPEGPAAAMAAWAARARMIDLRAFVPVDSAHARMALLQLDPT